MSMVYRRAWRKLAGFFTAGAFVRRQLDRLAQHAVKRKAHRAALRRAWLVKRATLARRHYVTPSGTSWRKLKRAVAQGYPAIQPSIHARLRHKWFQKEALAAGLRIRAGRNVPGDRELIDAVRIVIQSQRAAA
jgi:hypothetical protein